MAKKLKLRFLINSLHGGGAEKVLVDLLRKLDSEKYEITLVTIEGGVHSSRIPKHIKYKCIIPNSKTKIASLVKRVVYNIPPKVFSLLFLRDEYDIEIAYLEGTPTRFMASKKSMRISFVHCDISTNNIIESYYKNKEACLKEYQSFSKVCFVSEMSKRGFESTVGVLNNCCVIHNVLDYENLKILSLESLPVKYSTRGLKLLTIGRLIKEKSYDRLLRIVSKLEKEFDFELLILGEGEERSELEHIINAYDIKSAKLIGYQENPYVFMKEADLFVCSSLSEGYSTVVTESVALGLPVITTRCAGMEEILDNGRYGVIVENSEDALYLALRKVFTDKEVLNDLTRAVKEREILFDSEKEIKEYDKLFESLTI